MLVYRSVTHNTSVGFSMGQRFSESVDGRLTTEHVPPRLLRLTRHKAWNAARVEVLEDGFIKDQGNLPRAAYHGKGGNIVYLHPFESQQKSFEAKKFGLIFWPWICLFYRTEKNHKINEHPLARYQTYYLLYQCWMLSRTTMVLTTHNMGGLGFALLKRNQEPVQWFPGFLPLNQPTIFRWANLVRKCCHTDCLWRSSPIVLVLFHLSPVD